MTRFDYRQSALERTFGGRPSLVLDPPMRISLVALAAALLLVAVAALFEQSREIALDRDLTSVADRIAAAERDDARVERLERTVDALRAADDGIASARQATAVAANAIVRIGNRLPAQTWLTRVSSDRTGMVQVAGRSTRLDAIGTMLGTLAALDPHAAVSLVAASAAGRRGALLDFTVAVVPHR